jgi:hypothetical protein
MELVTFFDSPCRTIEKVCANHLLFQVAASGYRVVLWEESNISEDNTAFIFRVKTSVFAFTVSLYKWSSYKCTEFHRRSSSCCSQLGIRTAQNILSVILHNYPRVFSRS